MAGKASIKNELVQLRLDVMRLRMKIMDDLVREAAILQLYSQSDDLDDWPASSARETDQQIETLKARLCKLEARVYGAQP